MGSILYDELNQLDSILGSAKELSLGYLKKVNTLHTGKENPLQIFSLLPHQGLGTKQTQQLFQSAFLPNIVASSGSRYWGFVTGGTTPASIVGDWLTSVFDQNTQSGNGNGDVSAILEIHTVKLLLQLFGLPDDFTGAFVSGATMSNFTALAVARQWLGKQSGYDVAREGIKSNLKIYAAVPHSSAIKSLSMLGIGSSNIIIVPALSDRECIDTGELEKLISKNPGEPFILISSGGTVNTVDFDDMQFIASLKNKYDFWWHIDAAFGGFASCAEKYQHLLHGWERADSITIDNHKWLNVPYDSAVVFTRNEHTNLQVQTFQNSNAPYLGDPLQNFNFLNYVPENSRRFRALPVWFTLMAYGKDGYREIVETNIALARQLGKNIEESLYYKLMAPVRLNTVCFTTKENTDIKLLLHEMNKRGKFFMTQTVYCGKACIRAALVNWRTTSVDIEEAIKELTTVYEIVKSSKPSI